jgi:ATP-dependent helicase/nuclease subunit A
MNYLQLRASDPEISTWVSASAGTGKTKILTDRVIRLLLKNVKPSKILCLTFTNAAAGEMQDRIIRHLANWSNIDKKDLKYSLEQMLGSNVTDDQVYFASKLYENFLSSEEKVNIHTIHSFCQKLLIKFPLESAVSLGFKVIDDGQVFEIVQKIKKQIRVLKELQPISDYLSQNFHEVTIDEIFNEIINNKSKFYETEDDDVYQNSKAIIDKLALNISEKYRPILELPLVQNLVGYNSDVLTLRSFFLTSSGEKRARIVPKKIAHPESSLYSELEQIQHIVYLLDQEEKTDQLLKYSQLLKKLGSSIIAKYENYKKSKGLLDYDDLIIKANKLLRESSSRDWVLYKLDGGIEHLLVDEAQDTSPTQWQIIEALIEEFHSGSANQEERTIFVVGDEKQSIFSFQGADISSFSAVNASLRTKLLAARKNFETINLEISYRSAEEILDVTRQVFQTIKLNLPNLFPTNIPPITAFRSGHPGSVELWQLCTNSKKTEEFWPINNQTSLKLPVKEDLAIKIAEYIKMKIDSKITLPSTGKIIKPGDFMILFRTRNDFTLEVVKQLKHFDLEATGVDRIILGSNLAVLDLISLAKFVLNPEDNMNLACLLKSPLIGISEEELQELCLSLGKKSLWCHLQDLSHKTCDQLVIFCDLSRELNTKNFFHYVVDVLGFREKLVAAIGHDSDDAINELLHYSYNYAITHNVSLQNFIFWFENYSVDIKRSVENSNKIKIMTVHGSKGLQAPYVIMCDTTSLPIATSRFIWDKNNELLSAKNSNYEPEFFKNLKEEEKLKAKQEYLRLLYVAMTRAEDHLIICGYLEQTKLPDHCWYELVRDGMRDLEVTVNAKDGKIIYKNNEENLPNQIGFQINNLKTELNYPSINIARPRLPYRKAKIERQSSSFRSNSPISMDHSLKYGLIFHKILEDGIKTGSLINLKNHPLIMTVPKNMQDKIRSSVIKIINNKQFTTLLKGTIKTELALGEILEDKTKIGRIDLVIWDNNNLIIIDYKSDSNPPTRREMVQINYINQLNFYRNVMQKLYQNYKVSCKILWLDNGNLMDI